MYSHGSTLHAKIAMAATTGSVTPMSPTVSLLKRLENTLNVGLRILLQMLLIQVE
jgi:hypothetical protein